LAAVLHAHLFSVHPGGREGKKKRRGKGTGKASRFWLYLPPNAFTSNKEKRKREGGGEGRLREGGGELRD